MSTNSHFVGAAAVQIPNILIIDETRRYLEMILSSITEYREYNYKNHLWQLALDNDLIDAGEHPHAELRCLALLSQPRILYLGLKATNSPRRSAP